MSDTSSNISEVLLHGFTKSQNISDADFFQFSEVYEVVLERRLMRWQEFMATRQIERSRRLKRFCRKGIPHRYRDVVWMKLSGAQDRMTNHPGLYQQFLTQRPSDTLVTQILVDVPRTFPENVYFADDSPTSKLNSLTNVLMAFASYSSNVGYCQGFNYIVALLLLVLNGEPAEAEEKAFWLMDALVNHSMPTYYSDDMVSVRVDCAVLVELLKTKAPEVYEVIKRSDVNYTLLATRWFICLFADVLPIETSMRVFDCLFYEGDKILFRASIALIKLHHQQLIECRDFPALLTVFRGMCQDRQTLQCHQFLHAMFTLPRSFGRSKIARLRKKFASHPPD